MRARRLELGLKSSEMSERMGLLHNSLRQYELGFRCVHFGHAPRIAKAFEIPLERAIEIVAMDHLERAGIKATRVEVCL